MIWQRKTDKTFVELYIGTHEDTILSIEVAPRFKRGDHFGFCVGLSVLYLCLFHLECIRWTRKTTTLEYD